MIRSTDVILSQARANLVAMVWYWYVVEAGQ